MLFCCLKILEVEMNEYLLRRKLESIRNAGLNSEEYLSKIEIILKEKNLWEASVEKFFETVRNPLIDPTQNLR